MNGILTIVANALLITLLTIMTGVTGFIISDPFVRVRQHSNTIQSNLNADDKTNYESLLPFSVTLPNESRRKLLQYTGGLISSYSVLTSAGIPPAFADLTEDRNFVQQYEDFKVTPAGWSYRDVNVPTVGNTVAKLGDRVVFDWSGYTIGYFGRPFQAKGGPQGGAFDKDIDYYRTVIGSGTMIPALEQGMVGMSVGSIRQILVPYIDTLTYPESDLEHVVVGPKPTTFSGQRALNFVLQNPRLDRTLLFNVKIIRIDVPDGRGNFKRAT